MQYYINPKNGDKLSRLGFGCMRFERKGTAIDQKKAESEMQRAMELGVNYFDTAYIYPGSEVCLGKFLSQGRRKDAYIATKLPHYLIKNIKQVDEIFEEEKRRLQTEYIDYYLIHMLTDKASWTRMCELGICQWIEKKKKSGEIRSIGFSYHGGAKGFVELIDAYDWEFCQIQYNYVDEYSQAGRNGLLYAAEKGLPVVIMEPLRGGRLANKMPRQAVKILEKDAQGQSPASFALRWLWDQKEVSVVLSGMNSIGQIEENVNTLITTPIGSITDAEKGVYSSVKQAIEESTKVPCTGCGYCMPCPQGVDIPVCFRSLNIHASDGWFSGMREYVMCTAMRKESTRAGKCIGCGKCESHCPQGIQIRKELEAVKKTLETPIYKMARGVAKKIAKF